MTIAIDGRRWSLWSMCVDPQKDVLAQLKYGVQQSRVWSPGAYDSGALRAQVDSALKIAVSAVECAKLSLRTPKLTVWMSGLCNDGLPPERDAEGLELLDEITVRVTER